MGLSNKTLCGKHGAVTSVCELCSNERRYADLTAERAAHEATRAELEAARKDAERLRAIVEHGWDITRDIEGDWQIKSPKRYGESVLLVEHPSLHLAIDAAMKEPDDAR